MISIGIRELRQRASQYIDRVRRGDTIQVTDRGRPVALLVPIPEDSVIERLLKEGRLSAATGDLDELGPPLTPAEGVPLPSETLRELREDER
jgi:prevent-host-death family protein